MFLIFCSYSILILPQTTTNITKLISKACGFLVCYASRDEDGNTPLHTSACCGNVEAVKVFLEWQDSSLDRKEVKYLRNVDDKTPAHLAAEYDQPG